MSVFIDSSITPLFEAHPITLVDIGARGGLQPNWAITRKYLRVIGFEPDPIECARLREAHDRKHFVYINAAAHRSHSELLLNVARDPGTSSLLAPNKTFLEQFADSARFDTVEQVKVTADSLDTLLSKHDIQTPDFLKIDTQGAELPILEGAERVLATSVFGLEVEVQFAALYQGQSSFGEVETLLHGAGFQLMDLRHAYWKRARGARYGGSKGQLVFGDALYFKTERAFQQQLEAETDEHLCRVRLAHAMAISLLYGYVDYALELFEPNRQRFDTATAQAIETALRSRVAWNTRLPRFRGRGRLALLVYRLYKLLLPTAGGWASGGHTLGNLD
ncbi:MAG: FkbM family methyltransferase [Burkholderiales bacterium]